MPNVFVYNIKNKAVRKRIKDEHFKNLKNTPNTRRSGYGRVRLTRRNRSLSKPLCQARTANGKPCTRTATHTFKTRNPIAKLIMSHVASGQCCSFCDQHYNIMLKKMQIMTLQGMYSTASAVMPWAKTKDGLNWVYYPNINKYPINERYSEIHTYV